MPLKLSTRHDPLPTAIGAAAPQARNRPGPVRPRTLIAARWIALAGQAAGKRVLVTGRRPGAVRVCDFSTIEGIV